MHPGLRPLPGIVLVLYGLNAAPNVCYVVNDALTPADILPGVTVPGCSVNAYRAPAAQGSIISIIGENLGPSVEEAVAGFPIRTNLNGASVQLQVGSVSVNALILSIQHHRIRAMIPSRTPVGDGNVVASYNGSVSNPYPIRIVEHSLRIYSRSPQAWAHNVSAEGEWRTNRFSNPTRPGEQLVLWGTGLGAVDGDESAGPLTSKPPGTEIEVRLGLKPARILYAGRSGCCPGVDQIVIETPAGIEGCTVPVIARLPGDEIDEGYPTVAVASQAGGCFDPHGMSQAALRLVEANGSAKIGWVSLGDGGWWVPDGIVGSFSRFGTHYVMPTGTCGYPRWSPPLLPGSAFWDAGDNLTFTGPSEDRTVPHHEDYNSEILGSVYTLDFASRNLPAGNYSIHNGNGGANVGSFRINIGVAGSAFLWTNRETLAPIRGENLSLTWSITGSEEAFVRISGNFLTFKTDPNGYGLSGFTCLERVSSGGFTVPSWILWTPRSDAAEVLQLQITYFKRQEFAAPGLDFGEFTHVRQVDTVRKPITERDR